jgi:hypothetical protein
MNKNAAVLIGLVLAAAPAGAAQQTDIRKLAAGQLSDPISLQASPDGTLVLLDQRGNGATILVFDPEGKKISERALPVSLARPQTAAADSKRSFHVLADLKAWILPPDDKGEPRMVEPDVVSLTVKKTSSGEFLFLLKKQEVVVIPLPDGARRAIPLSAGPASGGLGPLRVRGNGHLYAYADAERLVWHFDAAGKLIEKFGSGGDIRCGIPSGCIGPHFDVDDRGDVFWSLADYGTLCRYTADGKTGVQYTGQEAWNSRWTGPIHTLSGFALSGDRAYETDRGHKRITSFPRRLVDAGAKDAETVSALAFGLNFRAQTDRPYKLFTGEKAAIRVAFDPGNRRIHEASLHYVLRDFQQRPAAQGTIPCALPGEAAATFDLPLTLPLLGWYQLDLALSSGKETLLERVVLLGRVEEDPRLPIPAKEVSGWNDLETHKMVGLGLHRVHFQTDPKEFAGTLQVIEAARKLGVPCFLQITDKKNCTPENVKAILEKVPDLPALEIVNEPNLNTSPKDYVRLLTPCYEAAKAANPRVIVLGPSQCGTELGWFEAFLKAGGGRVVDAVSVHTYMRHNSMDPCHWQWKMKRLREVMAANDCGDKPLWQTEHGFMADYHGHCLRHRWQARAVMLEYLTLDRLGIGPDRYFYYYLNHGGFGGFSSYLVSDRREPYPSALMLRERERRLGGRKFARALDLGTPGNLLALGNVYEGSDGDVLVLVNAGAFHPVEAEVALPAAARAADAFGNPVALPTGGRGKFAIDRYPTYVLLPRGAAVSVSVPGFGKNVAPEAKVETADPDAQKKAAFLTNGALEFDFADAPERDGFRGKPDALPLEVTFRFDAPRSLSGAIVYGSLADNDKCTPTEYEVQVRAGADWKKVAEVKVGVDGRAIVLDPSVKRLTWYDNPWIFTHRFPAVKTDALRIRITATTFGQWPVKEVMWGPLPARAHLREVQIFEAD